MTITVRLFALFRERLGRSTVELELSDDAVVADAITELAREPMLTEVIKQVPMRLAVNRDWAEPETQLKPGDELIVVPPVSGGAEEPRIHVRLTEEPLSLDALSELVAHPGAGARVVFQGTTREVTRLEYEAYSEMAEERMGELLTSIAAKHGLTAAAAEHRLGSVPLQEASIIIAVSAPHRGEAFAACREAIDSIKAEAPIWKKEIVEDGNTKKERWVGTAPPEEPK